VWRQIIRQAEEANKELWLFLMMFGILAAFNYLVASDRMLLGFYVLPTVFSAYFYGRRHATLTAFASILLVILIVYFNPRLFAEQGQVRLIAEKWWDIMVWGGTLIVIGYAMGTLYDNKEARIRELNETYHGIMIILQQFISHDQDIGRHSFHVAVYAAKIADYMGFDSERIYDVYDAAFLHDIGKTETSRELLRKAARLTAGEFKEIKKHVEKGAYFIQPLRCRLDRIIPIILAHHDKFDGSGYHEKKGEEIPLEARIITVADVFDAMTTDRPYRKAMSPFDAKETIMKGSGTDFDPTVVKAFLKAYRSEALEIDFEFLDMRRP
jgi:putative nucleotidyltransferase with HDIG domain